MKNQTNVVIKKECHCQVLLSEISATLKNTRWGFPIETLGDDASSIPPHHGASALVLSRRGRGKQHGGFTLIELLVVILIIGILAAVAVPQYQKVVLKSRAAEALNMLKTLDEALQVYYLANDEGVNSISLLDIDIPSSHVSTQFNGTSSQYPSRYMYSCEGGSCIANAKDRRLPVLQMTRNHMLVCAPYDKDVMAEDICKGLGGKFAYEYEDKWSGGKVNYYQLN